MPTFKSPLAQSESLAQVPTYNKDVLVHYLKNYGSGFDDENYEKWATQKGRELKKTPLNKDFVGTDYHKQWYGDGVDYTYQPQYLEDDEWLETVWPDVAEDAWEYFSNSKVDGDYTRSYGPVNSQEKYDAYLKWLKGGK